MSNHLEVLFEVSEYRGGCKMFLGQEITNIFKITLVNHMEWKKIPANINNNLEKYILSYFSFYNPEEYQHGEVDLEKEWSFFFFLDW